MEVVAVIPIKPLAQAKSRLAPHMEDNQRRRLVTAMLRNVIRAALDAGAEVWVLGADDSAKSVASGEGAVWHLEAGANINESLRQVFEKAWSAGKAPLFLPGDLPFIHPKDLTGLTSTTASNSLRVQPHPLQPRVVLSPARNGGGTNAILIPHQLPFQFHLGPDSLSRHVAEARRLGVDPFVHNSHGLARDLDTWEDLQEYESLHPGFLAQLTGEKD